MKEKKTMPTNWHIAKAFPLLICLGLLATSCDLFKMKGDSEGEDNPVLATVGKNNLKLSDIEFIRKDNQGELDSTELVNRYLQNWIKKQLMIREASKNLTINEAEIERKLLDYRYALIVYEFEKSFVEQKLDKEVGIAEIEEYYDKHKENFSLKEIIVRTNFVKLEKNLPQKRQLERLLRNQRDGDKNELKELALRYANNYYLEDGNWIKFDDIILNSPLAQNPNKVQLLKNGPLISVDDDNYTYYFSILEYKLQDQVPPLEFVRDEISKIIVNKRRVALAEQLHKDVYNKALDNNEFRIYD
ncbi:peptidylprolyl isomerase [Pleomorphovibrio marinus]|uniref:peptidylprolyl isomerase n=1 Tax=Pleomorphovibrio marinus TaxID=2164132 RepID=UPI000E0A9741|nr:peptidylprolyl isomerase [Pleomorphovibrio marinus]